ncbi:hairy-related 3 [Echeneis naucrates]|uniref:hairy-related 3 n=1 Tax=Echeneis naucrates TaxID=173247 RepID=UPI001113766B|nr:transcription factor HES-3 [Echeneis naucrates]
MVATTDCGEKSKPISGLKVSKPLMEKKRRARINTCLDQLKSLLETYYSSNIRKRKLEKADILELTVKHLRNLQKIQSCAAAASDFSDYQTGFRSCLANVNQYLLMADTLNGGDRWMLSQLSSKLSPSPGQGSASSTMDSGLGQLEIRDEPPSGPEEGHRSRLKGPWPHRASTPRLPSAAKRDVAAAAPSPHSAEKSPSHKKRRSVNHSNGAANYQQNVWRPW